MNGNKKKDQNVNWTQHIYKTLFTFISHTFRKCSFLINNQQLCFCMRPSYDLLQQILICCSKWKSKINKWKITTNFFLFAIHILLINFFTYFIKGICSRLQYSDSGEFIRTSSNHSGRYTQLYSNISAWLQYRYRENCGRIWRQSVHFRANAINSQ